MNQLPTEILVDIFSPLVFKDKLECALTCRDWYTKISCTVLYSRIGFKYIQTDVQTRVKDTTLYNTGVGLQVLDLRINEIDDPLELAELCPNLKSLQVNDWFSDDWNDNNNETLAQNWNKLETVNEARTDNIFAPCPRYYLTLKLLDAPVYMTSLTALTMNLFEREDVLPMLIEQLKHAPALDQLCLEEVPNLSYKRLDMLHGNVPNLKHLDLRKVNYLFVEDYDLLDEYEPLSMDSFAVENLRSISVTFSDRYNPELRSHNVELIVTYWIEYICRRYINISSISIPETHRTLEQNHKDIIHFYLLQAFGSWTRLKKLDMRSIYLDIGILHAMDDCNICLEELTVYVNDQSDMEQFSDLAHSKQGNTLKKLALYDISWQPNHHEDLISFLQSLKNCQLKVFEMPNRSYVYTAALNVLSPIQLLEYAPTLQRLCMSWAGTRERIHTISHQTTLLTHLDLRLCQLDYERKLGHNTQQHIQDVIDASPLLRSFSIDFDSNIYGVTLDLQLTKLEYLQCCVWDRDIIKIIQNNQTKWYSFYASVVHPEECSLKEESRKKKDSACRMILHLPLTVSSLFVKGYKCPL